MDIASRSSSNLAIQVLSRHKPERQDGRPQQRRAPVGKQTEAFMRISRRDLLLGSASALSAATLPFPKPAIAQSEPIKIGWLAAITGPSSAPTIGFNRGVNFAVGCDQRRRRRQGPQDRDRHARHPGRSDQGGERHPGIDQPGQGPRDLGAAQFGRGACRHADHGARQDAGHASLRGREPDRHQRNFRMRSAWRPPTANGTTPSAITASISSR